MTCLVMLPTYTRYLTLSDYGAVELLTMTITFVSIFIGLRISQAMFRFIRVHEWSESEKELVRRSLKKVSGSFRR